MGFCLIPSRPFPYTLKMHAGNAEAGVVPVVGAPVFRLRYLSSKLFSDLLEMMKTDSARAFFVVVSVGLVGWSNIERDGEPAPFVPAKEGKRLVCGFELEGGAADECVAALPYEAIVELAQKIIEANTLDRDSAKN